MQHLSRGRPQSAHVSHDSPTAASRAITFPSLSRISRTSKGAGTSEAAPSFLPPVVGPSSCLPPVAGPSSPPPDRVPRRRLQAEAGGEQALQGLLGQPLDPPPLDHASRESSPYVEPLSPTQCGNPNCLVKSINGRHRGNCLFPKPPPRTRRRVKR